MVMEQPKKPRKARRPIEAAQTKSFSNITRDSVCIRSKLLRLLLCIWCQNDIHTHDSYGSTLKKKQYYAWFLFIIANIIKTKRFLSPVLQLNSSIFFAPSPHFGPSNNPLIPQPSATCPPPPPTPIFHGASCQKRTDWKITYHFCYCSENKYDYDLQRSERLPQLVTTYPEMLVLVIHT